MDVMEKRYRIDWGDSKCENLGPPLRYTPEKAPIQSTLERVLSFEPNIESPYERPLYGEYDLDNLYPVSGLCLVCNNEKHKEIDQQITHSTWRQVAINNNIPFEVLVEHIARHMGPVYGRIAMRHLAKVPDPIAQKLISKVNTRELNDASFRTSFDTLYYPDTTDVEPESGEYGKLRVWTKERMMGELALREKEAIDYYDEMLKCKRDLEAVFDEIMGNDFYTITKKGQELPADKPYASAIAAKREVHSILTDLAKMSVIAARISASPGNDGMLLSPEIDSMVSSILGKDYKAMLKNAQLERGDDDTVDAMRLVGPTDDE